MATRARWLLVIAGVLAATAGFVGIVLGDTSLEKASPWWIIGAIGIVATVLGLGSPRGGPTGID
jgi:hypothetical protein